MAQMVQMTKKTGRAFVLVEALVLIATRHATSLPVATHQVNRASAPGMTALF